MVVFRGSKSSHVMRTGSVLNIHRGKNAQLWASEEKKNTNSRKHGCVCTFFDCFVHLVSNSVVFVRVPPVLTGQRAIRSLEPLSQRGQDACRSLTCNENDRHVTLHGANWQEEGSACKGSRWQIWHHASPGTVNALNNCTSHTLPLVASAGPPAITSRELHTQTNHSTRTSA